ncbi:MAG TPA: hypothetical protein VJR06_08085 [Nitrososphaerales archaeon]|nr:hypothetical protein [Nitrososphaerales archaeon]
MSSSGRYGDASAILYLVPFLVSGVYGLYLWVQTGLSMVLPSSVYLTVTRDPYVFIIGSIAIMLGVVLDLRGTDAAQRRARLPSLGNTLQSVAVASLALVVISAFYANGFINVTGAADDFIVGRYGLVFPAVLVLLSYLITAQFKLSSLTTPRVLGIIALLLVPASIYEIGKRQTFLGLGIAFVLLLIGLAVFTFPQRKGSPKKAEPTE